MDIITTDYVVTGTNTDIVWSFKYRLNGLLYQFKLVEGELDSKQVQWLFIKGKFPYKEQQIKGWKAIKNFKVTVGKPEVTFDDFFNAYAHKIKRKASETAWNRLSQKNKLLAIDYIPKYNKYVARKQVAKAMASTYLNQEYFLENHSSIH